jgi:hypothetical protein
LVRINQRRCMYSISPLKILCMGKDNQHEKGIVSRCMNSRCRFDRCIRGSVLGNKRKRVHCYLRHNTIDHDIFAIISRMSFQPTSLESKTVTDSETA